MPNNINKTKKKVAKKPAFKHSRDMFFKDGGLIYKKSQTQKFLEKLPLKRINKLEQEVIKKIKDAKVINKQGCKHQNKWISRNTGTEIEQMNGKKKKYKKGRYKTVITYKKKKRHKIFYFKFGCLGYS